jgi:hypothetical protein
MVPRQPFHHSNNPYWIVDTGAAASMTGDITKFITGSMRPIPAGDIIISSAGGHEIPVLCEGHVVETIQIRNGAEKILCNIVLYNVLYAPTLEHNLLSLSFLNEDGYAANFLKSGAYIYRPGMDMSVSLQHEDNLFLLPTHVFTPQVPRLEDVRFTGVNGLPTGICLEETPSGSSEWKRDDNEF